MSQDAKLSGITYYQERKLQQFLKQLKAVNYKACYNIHPRLPHNIKTVAQQLMNAMRFKCAPKEAYQKEISRNQKLKNDKQRLLNERDNYKRQYQNLLSQADPSWRQVQLVQQRQMTQIFDLLRQKRFFEATKKSLLQYHPVIQDLWQYDAIRYVYLKEEPSQDHSQFKGSKKYARIVKMFAAASDIDNKIFQLLQLIHRSPTEYYSEVIKKSDLSKKIKEQMIKTNKEYFDLKAENQIRDQLLEQASKEIQPQQKNTSNFFKLPSFNKLKLAFSQKFNSILYGSESSEEVIKLLTNHIESMPSEQQISLMRTNISELEEQLQKNEQKAKQTKSQLIRLNDALLDIVAESCPMQDLDFYDPIQTLLHGLLLNVDILKNQRRQQMPSQGLQPSFIAQKASQLKSSQETINITEFNNTREELQMCQFKLVQHNKNHQILWEKLTKKDQLIIELQSELKGLRQQKEYYERQVQDLSCSVKELQEKNLKQSKKLAEQVHIEMNQLDLQSSKQENTVLREKIRKLEEQHDTIFNETQSLRQLVSSLRGEIKIEQKCSVDQRRKIQELELQIVSLQETKSNSSSFRRKQNENQIELTSEIDRIRRQNTKLEEEKSKMAKILNKYQSKITELNKRLAKNMVPQEVQRLKIAESQLQQVKLERERMVLCQNGQIQRLKSELHNALQEIKIMTHTLEEMKVNNVELSSLNLQHQRQKDIHLFSGGQLLQDYNHQRSTLIKTLTKHSGKINKTKLLYRFDRLNKTNFHRYFDHYPNIVLVVRTIYGRTIAAYTQSPFQIGKRATGQGLLMALWADRVWQLLPDKRAITYDDYYMIFGNSQLRIKAQQAKIFSNFGIANRFYEGGKVQDFLGDPQRQIDISSYEIWYLEMQ